MRKTERICFKFSGFVQFNRIPREGKPETPIKSYRDKCREHMVKNGMLLLFSWSPACVVRIDYEVVMLQPWSGTAPILGSNANVMYYQSPSHRFNSFSGSLSFTFRVLTPPPSATLILRCTTIYNLFYPLFRYGTACQPRQRSNIARLHEPYLRSMYLRP